MAWEGTSMVTPAGRYVPSERETPRRTLRRNVAMWWLGASNWEDEQNNAY